MIKLTAKARAFLKKPLGKICKTLEQVKRFSYTHKLVAVGDITTLALLSIGIKPYVAVFDYKFMRKPLDKIKISILGREFPKIKKMSNKAGTLSEEVMKLAPSLMRFGGALKVNGEEDLTALAFILSAPKDVLVVYGQPDKGLVLVEPKEKLKKKLSLLLGIAKKKGRNRN